MYNPPDINRLRSDTEKVINYFVIINIGCPLRLVGLTYRFEFYYCFKSFTICITFQKWKIKFSHDQFKTSQSVKLMLSGIDDCCLANESKINFLFVTLTALYKLLTKHIV